MREFVVAAKAEQQEPDEDYIEVKIGDRVLRAYRPTTAQLALLTTAMASDGFDQMSAIFNAIESFLGADGLAYIRELITQRAIDIDDLIGGSEQNPDGGILDAIVEEFSARPTQPSTASSSSQRSTGRRSTGRSPGKGSTQSSSPSTDS